MGTQQQFCLRWNNHQSNMLSVFDDLFQNEALVDVTLACEGLSIKAHKMVLSACSPYFQSLFLDNPCKHPIVILKDVRFADLKALMDFMYKGEVNVSQEQLSTLLKTAETLKVRGLTEVAGNANDIHNSILTQQPGLTHHLPPPRSGGAPQLQPQPLPAPPQLPIRSSPSPKRRKVQDRHRSEPSSSQSEHEDSDSHELIEPKVEITEEAVNDERSSDLVTKNTPSSLARTGQSVDFHSNSSQGLSSAQAASPTSDQNFSARSSSLSSQNATPPQLYNPSAPVSVQPPIASVQTIGQPPVLQGTSQALPPAPVPILMATSSMMNLPSAPSTSRQDSGPRPCDICQKIISSPSNMKKHMDIHCRRMYTCEDCFTTYTYVDSLRRHLRVKHGKRLKKDRFEAIGLITCAKEKMPEENRFGEDAFRQLQSSSQMKSPALIKKFN